MQVDIPVVGIGTWELRKEGREAEKIKRVQTPEEAVEKALEAAREGYGNGR